MTSIDKICVADLVMALHDIAVAKDRLRALAGEPDMATARAVAGEPHKCIQRALDEPDGPEAA